MLERLIGIFSALIESCAFLFAPDRLIDDGAQARFGDVVEIEKVAHHLLHFLRLSDRRRPVERIDQRALRRCRKRSTCRFKLLGCLCEMVFRDIERRQ